MPDGYIKGSNGQLVEIIDAAARKGLAKKLPAPATAKVGDYLRISAVNTDGSFTVEAVAAPTVPTKVSAFENDAGYQTEAQVNALLAAFPTFEIQVVAQLPAEGAEKTIYLVPFADDSGSYLEYLYVNGAWEIIGSRSGENVTIDNTLTQSGAAADAAAVGERLKVLEGVANGDGLSAAQINALDGMFKVCAYTQADVSAQYNAFRAAFGLDSSDDDSGGDTTDKTLTSISAAYSGGPVAVGTAVSALTGVVVTAHYSDGTSEAVTGYTLSGTIAEGSNTITVSYGGKTTTFTVTGAAESGGDTVYTNTIFPLADGTSSDGAVVVENNHVTISAANRTINLTDVSEDANIDTDNAYQMYAGKSYTLTISNYTNSGANYYKTIAIRGSGGTDIFRNEKVNADATFTITPEADCVASCIYAVTSTLTKVEFDLNFAEVTE